MFSGDLAGAGGARQRQWTQSFHLTETGTGPVLPKQSSSLLQLSFHPVPRTAAL